MAMFYGLASFGAGVLMARREKSAFWSAARSFLALHLMLGGVLIALIGLSERRARAQFQAAVHPSSDAKADAKASSKAEPEAKPL